MICFYHNRIRIVDSQILADLLFKLYQNWANRIGFLYCFRTWILHYSMISKDGDACVAVKAGTEGLATQFQKFKTAAEKLTVEELLKPYKRYKDKQNLSTVVEYTMRLRQLVNNL